MSDELIPSGGEWRGVKAWLVETALAILFLPVYIFLVLPYAILFFIDEKSARFIGLGIRRVRVRITRKVRELMGKS